MMIIGVPIPTIDFATARKVSTNGAFMSIRRDFNRDNHIAWVYW